MTDDEQKKEAEAFENSLERNAAACKALLQHCNDNQLTITELRNTRKSLRNLQKAVKANPKWGGDRAFDVRMHLRLVKVTIDALESINSVLAMQASKAGSPTRNALDKMKDMINTEKEN